MIYDLQNDREIQAFNDKCLYFKKQGKTVDLIEKKNTRTNQQNKALHLLYTIMTNQLNELGLTYKYYGLKGQIIETRYTTHIVKEFFWRPIQIALFDIKSTTKINTTHINEIMDVIINFFAEKGVVIEFPNKKQIDNLINK